MVCTVGYLTSMLLLLLRFIAMENGWSGRKYIGYVLAVCVRETPCNEASLKIRKRVLV